MFIESIEISNFRAYKEINTVCFERSRKNVYLIAGNNGFGKTTFLTSLVWCLYGKLMGDVDDKFRREINDSQGYKNFLKNNLNKKSATDLNSIIISPEEKKEIVKKGYKSDYEWLRRLSQYYVEICIGDVFIPSIPCNTISIRRTFDSLLEIEQVEVLIDGHINELAKEVGYDIFINDFILSKDIAKFFLFDAEKIVSLAEVKSIEEKRKLSLAYSEVLGIKKYEDIKRNLENLRVKFRRMAGNANSSVNRQRMEKLSIGISSIESDIATLHSSIFSLDNESFTLKQEREALQEKLLREGNAMSIEDLNRQKDLLRTLQEKDQAFKVKFKEMLDIAPFAISGNVFSLLKVQVETEKRLKNASLNNAAINAALTSTYESIISGLSKIEIPDDLQVVFKEILDYAFLNNYSEQGSSVSDNDGCILLDYSQSEINEFQALYDKIKYSYSTVFKQLVKDMRNNSLLLVKTLKRINTVENTDSGIEIKNTRARKEEVEKRLEEIDYETRCAYEKIGAISKELANKKKQLAEALKTIRVDEKDKEKDEIAERLIEELSAFLFNLRNKRKQSLARKIKEEIGSLMHKEDFIHEVQINIKDDIIDIVLLDYEGNEINKEKLSKGEQQLYATAILKALVDESGISFPVFIDSPLQKFDSIHAHNIISKFYPNVSYQVVIFPLLGKELSKEEYLQLLPHVNGVYVIKNDNEVSSIVQEQPNALFNN